MTTYFYAANYLFLLIPYLPYFVKEINEISDQLRYVLSAYNVI